MIPCPVCGAGNHHLAVVCASCGGFVQRKVDNLDLFHTAWGVIESPRSAFREIALSRHKNYVTLLAACSGFSFAFLLFSILQVGDSADSLLNVIFAGIAVGPPVGVAACALVSFFARIFALAHRIEVSFRNLMAVTAYALIPVSAAGIFLIPIALMTFGLFLFSSGPSPYALKPASWTLLAILGGASCLWSLALYLRGMWVLSGAGWPAALRVGFGSLIIAGAAAAAALRAYGG